MQVCTTVCGKAETCTWDCFRTFFDSALPDPDGPLLSAYLEHLSLVRAWTLLLIRPRPLPAPFNKCQVGSKH